MGRLLGCVLVLVAAGCGDECVPQVGTCNCGVCVDDFGCSANPGLDPCRCLGECGGSGGQGGAGGEGTPTDPTTVDGVIEEREDQKSELAMVYCGCRAFLDDLEGVLQMAIDQEACFAGLTGSDADLECLSRNFGDDPPAAVPGLACDLEAHVEATTCVEALQCGADAAPAATQCFFDFDDRVDGCDFGSISSADPPDLLECF